jgi:hypothetical protein
MALLRLLLATAVVTAASSAATHSPRRPDLITVVVTDAATGRAVPYPMICIREFHQPIGPIGDSTGRAMFGGNLPAGTIHLRIKAPEHMDFDTTALWPSAAELQVKLKRRSGPPTTPQCEVAAPRPRTNLSRDRYRGSPRGVSTPQAMTG